MKGLQTKIEQAQQDLQENTKLYNALLEKDKQIEAEDMQDLSEAKIFAIKQGIGIAPAEDQLKQVAKQLEENAAKQAPAGVTFASGDARGQRWYLITSGVEGLRSVLRRDFGSGAWGQT